MKLTNEKKARLIALGRTIWELLDETEKENYCGTGTIGFVEDVAMILGLGLYKCSTEELNYIHERIIEDTE